MSAALLRSEVFSVCLLVVERKMLYAGSDMLGLDAPHSRGAGLSCFSGMIRAVLMRNIRLPRNLRTEKDFLYCHCRQDTARYSRHSEKYGLQAESGKIPDDIPVHPDFRPEHEQHYPHNDSHSLSTVGNGLHTPAHIPRAYSGEHRKKNMEHRPVAFCKSLPVRQRFYHPDKDCRHPVGRRISRTDDIIAVIDNALENGYTVAWASDVSEKGFTRDGIGIVPDYDKLEIELKETGSDQARWIGASKNDLYKKAFDAPCPELEITQEMRQEGYDNYQTTDDHGMQIFGIAKDQNGKKYYMVKNSWGDAGKYKGIWYVSEAFVRYKTMDILVNKNAIPQDIRAKMNL